MKFAYIDNGLHSFQAFSPLGKNFFPLSIWDINKYNICKFGAIIIPFHTDQMALNKFQRRLDFYLKRGGTLILLGIMANRVPWIPYCEWKGPFSTPKNIIIDRSGAGELILSGIEDKEIHRLHNHGTFTYSGGNSLIKHSSGRNIMVVDTESYLGNLLLTTLDPDHHVVADTTGINRDIAKISHRLLQNIVDWSEYTHSLQKGFKWRMRRLKSNIEGFLRSSLFQHGFLSICIVSLLIFLSLKANFYFTLVVGIASVIALQISFLKK